MIKSWKLSDEILIRLYTLVLGRTGFYRYLAKKYLQIMREHKIPMRKRIIYLIAFCETYERAIIDEIEKLLTPEEREELDRLHDELEHQYTI